MKGYSLGWISLFSLDIGEVFRLMLRFLKENRDSSLPSSSLGTGWGLLLRLLAGISTSWVHSFFDTNLYFLQLSVLFWFMLALSISMQKITAEV